MFPASPTSSPNLSVKKSILAHKSLIQWSFPVKRVKCYLIECAVSYQRETARPALTIHITRVTCIQVHVNRGWKNIYVIFGQFSVLLDLVTCFEKNLPLTKSLVTRSSNVIQQREERSCLSCRLTSDIQIHVLDPGQLVFCSSSGQASSIK